MMKQRRVWARHGSVSAMDCSQGATRQSIETDVSVGEGGAAVQMWDDLGGHMPRMASAGATAERTQNSVRW
jgi:hypothetical protein